MSFSKSFLVLVLSVSAVGLAFPANTPPVVADAKSTPILPQGFAGWQVQGTAQTSADARIADPANAAILKEFGFSDEQLREIARNSFEASFLPAEKKLQFLDMVDAFS